MRRIYYSIETDDRRGDFATEPFYETMGIAKIHVSDYDLSRYKPENNPCIVKHRANAIERIFPFHWDAENKRYIWEKAISYLDWLKRTGKNKYSC